MLGGTLDSGTCRTRIEIEPSASWRPWKGYWSRWWFEIAFQVGDGDWTLDVERMGGALTLRRAIKKAQRNEDDTFTDAMAVVKKRLEQTMIGGN